MLTDYEFRDTPLHVFKTCGVIKEFPLKFHKQIEICLVLDGVFHVEIDGKMLDLKQGDVYMIFPNIPHAAYESPASVIVALIDAEIFPAYHDILSHQRPQNPILPAAEVSTHAHSLFQQIFDFYCSDSPFRTTVLHSLLNALLGMLLSSCRMVPRDSENELIEKILVYFSDHFKEQITLEDIAKEFNYSKYYISHIINDTLQCNFSTLINSYRISLAQNLLISTNKSVGDIATECGFRNQSSFNRVFVKQVGMPPCSFRSKIERFSNSKKQGKA